MDRFDVLAGAGLILIAIGIGLLSIPAGLIAFGAGLMGLGILGAAGHRGQTRRTAPTKDGKP